MSIAHAGRLLRRVEAHHDERGWHRTCHMWVYAIHDHHDVVTAERIRRVMRDSGPPIMNSRYSAQPMLRPQHFSHAFQERGFSAGESLLNFAMNVALLTTDDLHQHHSGCAHAMLGPALDRFRAVLRQPGMLGFIACGELLNAAGESRIATMVDMHDRAHEVLRPRGGTAQLSLDVDDDSSVVAALRMMTDVTQNRVPPEGPQFNQRYSVEITYQ